MAEKSRELSYLYPEEARIIKQGYLKKLKNKSVSKRYFVIWADADVSKLAYFDTEKKFRNKAEPNKPPIVLKNCFNINKTTDNKHKFVTALYTEDDCLQLVAESEEEQEAWINMLWQLHRGKSEDGEPAKPQFEHVWQVNVKEKGLGGNKIVPGPYRLCLTDKTVELIGLHKTNNEIPTYLFQLQAVRRYGHTECFFHMEVGRHTITGEGQLWMRMEDAVIAQNVHETLLHAITNCSSEKPPPMRNRSQTSVHKRSNLPPAARPRCNTGSSPRPRSEVPLRPGSRSPVNTSRSILQSSGTFRDRSDSVDSRGTSSSISTDNECEPSPKIPSTRTRTPDSIHTSSPISIPSHPDSQSPYVSMDENHSPYVPMEPKHDTDYMQMSPAPSTPIEDPYMSMTPMSSSPAVSTKSNQSEEAHYLDMAPVTAHPLPTVQEKFGYGYMDMKPGSSPSTSTSSLRPTKGYSYLMEGDILPKRHNSVGSRPNTKLSLKNKTYMDGVTKQGVLDASKSCSAPHLIPTTLSALPPQLSSLDNVQEHFMEMEFGRPRTCSDVGQMMRPRTSSWTQYHRPRAASHGQKAREKWNLERQKSLKSTQSGNRSSNESLKSLDSSKKSSESLTKEGYMDMNFHHARSHSQPSRQNSNASQDYMCMSPGVKSDKIGTGTSTTGDYVPMNPPQGSGKVTPIEFSSSPRHKAHPGLTERSLSDLSQGRRSSIGSSGRKVPVFKLTTAVSSDSDSSTSGCHSSHSDLCPSPSLGQSSAKDQVDSNGRGSLSQGSETDESGSYMNMSYEGKSEKKESYEGKSEKKESKRKVIKKTSDIPDSYMPITYDKKKDTTRKSPEINVRKSPDTISKDTSTKSTSSKSPTKTSSPAPVVDSYMTFTPGVGSSAAEEVQKPEKVAAYVRSQPPPAKPMKPQQSAKKNEPPKKPRRNSKPKLLVSSSESNNKTSDYAMMAPGVKEVQPPSPKPEITAPEPLVRKAIPTPPVAPLSVSVNTNTSIPRRSSSSQLSDGESSTPRARRSITEPLPSPCRSTSSRHSSGASTTTTTSDQDSLALNYASLDLSESSSGVNMPPKSPRKPISDNSEGDSPLMYSQIDFVKSEALKAEPPKLRENRTSFTELR